jgi:hypothetical protein
MRTKTILVMLLLACAPAAQAHRSTGRNVVGFATSRCVSTGCYSKHSEGRWRHPLTARSRGFPG